MDSFCTIVAIETVSRYGVMRENRAFGVRLTHPMGRIIPIPTQNRTAPAVLKKIHRMKTKLNNRRPGKGFTMVEVIIVLAVLAVFGAMLLPKLTSRRTGCRISCTNNLKQIGLSFRLWSGDNNDRYPMQLSVRSNGVLELVEAGYIAPAFTILSNELSTPRVLRCPEDKVRKMAVNFSRDFYEANISYFLGLDASELAPQMILTGDDNIEVSGKLAGRGRLDITKSTVVSWSDQRHNRQGNVCLADGSVQGLSTNGLRSAIRNISTNNLRLAFP